MSRTHPCLRRASSDENSLGYWYGALKTWEALMHTVDAYYGN